MRKDRLGRLRTQNNMQVKKRGSKDSKGHVRTKEDM